MVVPRPLFIAHLPESEREIIGSRACLWHARKGSTVHAEGEPVKALYMLDAGCIQFEMHSFDGRKLILGFVNAGHAFGELEVLEGGPALATAVVKRAVTGWQLGVKDFHDALPHAPHFAAQMLRSTARNARIHHLLYRNSLLMRPEERLALALLGMERHPAREQAGDASTPNFIPTTQDMLAQMLGATRQCVSKHLRQWEAAGWIDIQYGGITLLNRPAISGLLPRR